MFERILSDVLGMIYMEAVVAIMKSSKGVIRYKEMLEHKKFCLLLWFSSPLIVYKPEKDFTFKKLESH